MNFTSAKDHAILTNIFIAQVFGNIICPFINSVIDNAIISARFLHVSTDFPLAQAMLERSSRSLLVLGIIYDNN